VFYSVGDVQDTSEFVCFILLVMFRTLQEDSVGDVQDTSESVLWMLERNEEE
jgi:hypothetical protein